MYFGGVSIGEFTVGVVSGLAMTASTGGVLAAVLLVLLHFLGLVKNSGGVGYSGRASQPGLFHPLSLSKEMVW